MRLYEYESKMLLEQYKVPLPKRILAKTPEEAAKATEELGGRAVIKAQVLTGGRGKAGGVKIANSPEEAKKLAEEILKMKINQFPVVAVLVEEVLDIDKELFLACTYDEVAKQRIMLISDAGGVDINEVVEKDPSRVYREWFNPFYGMMPFKAKKMADFLKLPKDADRALQSVITSLYKLAVDYDATLAEINPLVLTKDGKIVAADAHIEIEDDAMYRQQQKLEAMGIHDRPSSPREPTEFEKLAEENDLSDHRGVAGRAIDFGGTLGCIIGAGGGSLTTFDAILRYGGNPANYCEVGGNPPVKKVYGLAKLVLTKPGVKGLLVCHNVYSNSRVDLVARGVIKAMLDLGINPAEYPVVYRGAGAFEEDGYAILRKYGIRYYDRRLGMDQAAKLAVEMIKLIEEKEKQGMSLEEAQKEVSKYIKTEEFVKKVLGEEVAKKVLEGL